MSVDNTDLQKYIGQNVYAVQQELEGQGYQVHLVRIGRFATGNVPPKIMHAGDTESKQPKRAIISYNGDDPEEKIVRIRED